MVDVIATLGLTVNLGDGSYAAGMANFAVRLVHGPYWDSSRQIRDQEGWAGHAAFMDELVDDDYGFGWSGTPNRSVEEHRESIRAFLAMIDPDTGHIGDD